MCVNLPNIWVNFIFLRKFCKEIHYFLEKFRQSEFFCTIADCNTFQVCISPYDLNKTIPSILKTFIFDTSSVETNFSIKWLFWTMPHLFESRNQSWFNTKTKSCPPSKCLRLFSNKQTAYYLTKWCFLLWFWSPTDTGWGNISGLQDNT